MKPAPQREAALFQAAAQLSGSARHAFLESACGDDPALRQRLEALLAAHEQSEGVLGETVSRSDEFHESRDKNQGRAELGPPGAAPRQTMKLEVADVPDETVGQKIGRYKILEKVGEGGCGVVYVAEQTEPVRRRVALKVIKLGMDTKQVVARFEAERQALAMMDHPNIAKVLDAGATEAPVASGILPDVEPGCQPGGSGDPISGGPEHPQPAAGGKMPPTTAGRMPAATLSAGRPYFIMELVRGIKVTDYCDQNNLSTAERLDLFIQICHAIQHAHQKGIIHRDIKPSNILVTLHDGVPVPKVIDFGIAKATEGRLTDNTVYTQLHQFIGTPAYMSPEQAEMSGLDVDTRSDIYSLGVLLYELLTGKTPFDAQELMSQGIDAMRKTIRERDPVRPSTKLGTLRGEELTTTAKRRSVETSKLAKLLSGDLDWIVMKCLEKDRTRRYETANGLAMDLKRHLHNEPVLARPPSKIYRLQKAVRRNKVAVALTTLALLACGAAIILGAMGNIERLKRRAQALIIEQTGEREKRETWARLTAMPAVKQLVEDGRLIRAFRMAREIQRVLPDDPAFRQQLDSFTATASFDSLPPGTKVFVRDWNGDPNDWMEVGETPLKDVLLPKGDLRFRYVKEGYLTREFVREFPQFLEQKTKMTMSVDSGVPEGMVFVNGVEPSPWNNLPVSLGDFLIDRYEVSNREFQEFVNAGGYDQPRFWEGLQFEQNGKNLSWQEAVAQFRDATGKAGPAGWRNGQFPDGRADYPVTGVSWFEAMAYAKFAGKSLPTIHHWRWASDGPSYRILPLSNFSGQGPTPRGANLGIGRFDVYDMAGNVKEWCWNQDSRGQRCVRGGAWNDAKYQLVLMEFAAPWHRSDRIGFRCVRYLDETGPPKPTLAPWQNRAINLTESDRIPLDSIKSWFVYDTNQPLRAKTIELDHKDFQPFRHEIVQIDAAYNNERFEVHLFFPNQPKDKYETILFVPGAAAWLARQFSANGAIEMGLIPRLLRTGRMVCLPVCKGMFERGDGEMVLNNEIGFRDELVAWTKDVARTRDYLRTRGDVDSSKMVYLGYSAGAMFGPPALVTCEDLKAAILVSGGYPSEALFPQKFIFHPFQLTPHVKLPVLMISGGLDTTFPMDTSQIPFYEDLGSATKKHVVLDGGHTPSNDLIVETADKWLQELLGAP